MNALAVPAALVDSWSTLAGLNAAGRDRGAGRPSRWWSNAAGGRGQRGDVAVESEPESEPLSEADLGLQHTRREAPHDEVHEEADDESRTPAFLPLMLTGASVPLVLFAGGAGGGAAGIGLGIGIAGDGVPGADEGGRPRPDRPGDRPAEDASPVGGPGVDAAERPGGAGPDTAPDVSPARPPAGLALSVRGVSTTAVGTLLTNDGTVQVSGLEPGASWWFSLDYGVTWERGVDDRVPGDRFGPDGVKSLQVYQEDLAGNESPRTQLDFLLDKTAPAEVGLRLTHDTGLPDDGLTRDWSFAVEGLEPDGGWRFSVDDGPWQSGTGHGLQADFAGDAWSDGLHVLRVVALDAAGNTSAATTLHVVVDRTPPATAPSVGLRVDTGQPGDRLTRNPELAIEGLDADARWSISVDDGKTWIRQDQVASSADLFTHDGEWRATVRQEDAAGNVGPASAPFVFVLDRTKPSALTIALKHDTGADATDHVTRDATVIFGGQEAGATLRFSIDGGAWREAPGDEIAAAEFITQGWHSVQAHQVDAAGNVGSNEVLRFLLDTTEPLAPQLALLGASQPDLGAITALAAMAAADRVLG